MPARYGSDLVVDLLKVLGIEYVSTVEVPSGFGGSFTVIQTMTTNEKRSYTNAAGVVLNDVRGRFPQGGAFGVEVRHRATIELDGDQRSRKRRADHNASRGRAQPRREVELDRIPPASPHRVA